MKTQVITMKLSIWLSLKRYLHLSCATLFTIFGLSALLVVHPVVLADELKVPVGQQSEQNRHIERPASGMTKSQVEQRYGKPQSMGEAVGEPPISSWEYTDYTVYFEYERVIHTVLK